MYYIYLYSVEPSSNKINDYGYWSGNSFHHDKQPFPICCKDSDNERSFRLPSNQKKEYKSLKRAITSGWGAYEKYYYVTAFDIRDEEDKIVYQSYPMFQKKSNAKEETAGITKNRANTLQKEDTSSLDMVLEFKEQIALCQDFLGWLQNRYAMFDKKVPREDAFYRGDGDFLNIKKIVYDYIGIDQAEVDEELDSLLEEIMK